MKTYVCDACKTVVGDPYKVGMKEFMYTAEYDFGFVFPVKTVFRKKLHLCGRCFDNLRKIAIRKEAVDKICKVDDSFIRSAEITFEEAKEGAE